MDDGLRLEDRTRAHQWKDRVRLPPARTDVPQHEEWCEVKEGDEWQRIRFHDYASIFERPGLYEHLFYDRLECNSPRRVVQLLREVLAEPGSLRDPLRAIDLGAGNGIVAKELRRAGADAVIGIDIIPEAKSAAERDRPEVYTRYLVADLCTPTPQVESTIRDLRPNALVCVAALGFGDIPPLAYFNSLAFVPKGGVLAFNIKEEFLDQRYAHGFSELVRRMLEAKVIRLEASRRYCHRLSVAGEPLFYHAMVATKLDDVPRSMLVES
ncbi:MAG: methyltransferase domain-containing protein [Polyangiaceae bacterium]